MKVNFDNLRKQTMVAYSDLVEKLNAELACRRIGDPITIELSEIQEALGNLRRGLVGIACCYSGAEANFSTLADEARKMPHFNPENEDENADS